MLQPASRRQNPSRAPTSRAPAWTRWRPGTGTRSRPLGKSTLDLSSPLEDGTRVLDIVTDLPECRIQATFRPEEDSTMITVLFGAGVHRRRG